ncbi:uncharacterized protein LOC117292639 [Asterias rubens]|uniref:uncharacterized protein LOC117292639 n=1 Tax=Asterias rubens TaxID=7604 RepID=UPI0014558B48|nr:uncharacterized protein LOC117292639 [Asterias rubens]XP_033630656.1 uncharacterized protein LOC117292639 [Asterias rubens]XP_033630657.1 uncharacterized protein LOC117292639 [Asterias rubens]
MAASVMDLRSKRTKAVPPRSLFGTIVEIKDEQALAETGQAEALPTPAKPDKLASYRDPKADTIIKANEVELRKQAHKVKHASGNLDEMQHYAIHFNPDPDTIKPQIPVGALTFSPKRNYSPYQNDVKHNPRDIALGEQFNRLGLDQRMDYNYERFRQPAKNSKYQHAGNALGKGGMFSYKGKKYATVQGRGSKSRSGTGLAPVEFPNKVKSDDIFYIPANIRHTHGQDLCNTLLKNPEEFRQSMEAKEPARRRMVVKSSPSDHIALTSEPFYDALGNALRQDIFNGVAHSHIKSLNTSSYTDEVASKSTESYPPKFGVQRNADSKWNEDNVLRQRMKKQWDNMLQGGKKD